MHSSLKNTLKLHKIIRRNMSERVLVGVGEVKKNLKKSSNYNKAQRARSSLKTFFHCSTIERNRKKKFFF